MSTPTQPKPSHVETTPAEPARNSVGSTIGTSIFVFVPLLALILGLPLALSGVLPLTWLDLSLLVVFYFLSSMGITVGYHRYFTHSAFKTNTPVRWALAACGSMAVQGRVCDWVGDHRKHHSYSDKDGDPHSPWRFGTRNRDVAKGLWYAHMGWLFAPSATDVTKYAPDILADKTTRRASNWFAAYVAFSLVVPTAIGGLVTWSWMGAISAFFWAGLFRIALLHQVTWSINSLCHVFGSQPFRSRDDSRNLAWLSLLSVGESWHNYHHADPTSARHGVLRGQIDLGAGVIRILQRLGLAKTVRWPSEQRVREKLKPEYKHRQVNLALIADSDTVNPKTNDRTTQSASSRSDQNGQRARTHEKQ